MFKAAFPVSEPTNCAIAHANCWLTHTGLDYYFHEDVDVAVVSGRTDDAELDLKGERVKVKINLNTSCAVNLTQCHSCRWIVVQHVTNDLEELQVLRRLRHDVPMKWLCVIAHVATSR